MKKIIFIFCLLFIGTVAILTSCKKNDNKALVSAFWNGTTHSFGLQQTMTVYQTTGQMILSAAESNTQNKIKLTIEGIATGSDTTGPGWDNNIILTIDSNTYSTGYNGGDGVINITSLDTVKFWIKGDFSGTVVNSMDSTDVITVTQGTFSLKYQD